MRKEPDSYQCECVYEREGQDRQTDAHGWEQEVSEVGVGLGVLRRYRVHMCT